MRCADVDKFIHAYIDGEFADEDRTEFELHLLECERCHRVAAFEVRFKQQVREAIPKEAAPPALRERILGEIEKAEARRSVRRALVPAFALTAACAVIVGLVWRGRSEALPVVEESISRHKGDLPVEVVGPDGQRVASWFQGKMPVPVRAPQWRPVGADLLGGRMSHVSDREAAHLIYNLRGKKVSVFVFDPGDKPIPVRHARRIGNHEVALHQRGNYSVAVFRQGRVGYAITSDLPESEMLQLVSAAVE